MKNEKRMYKNFETFLLEVNNIKKISILGSTGSIGTQLLETLDHIENIKVVGISGNLNISLLEKQIEKYKPKYCAVLNEKLAKELKNKILNEKTKILSGIKGICEIAAIKEVDLVVCAISGMAGLLPIIEAIKAKKNIAIANKEPIVAAGNIIIKEAKKNDIKILPIDSEHSAIFQCLRGNKQTSVEKIILTASGGPFYNKKRTELENVSKKEVLNHPKWSMGKKITVDSATLMNKGFEIIEARWLFDVENIEAIAHPDSIIHSMVQYIDGNVIAQLSIPNMKYPLQYALTFPERLYSTEKRLDFKNINNLSFGELDEETFHCLKLSKKALKSGGLMPCILNSANEIAVEKFLNDEIKFLDIERIVERELEENKNILEPTIDDILSMDSEIKEKYKKRTLD
ncbi:MAG: 1-deoxy-D-xylulose-5-phosphate reductoisomerase [Clostridiales bacterium]|jgi:1-deoxy-D-xylulose-5-phosphate reductoisomerase|nr:1-deoxy-D-xylulose-5-phosphate reductoisomerase [Clostridiales bacterium]